MKLRFIIGISIVTVSSALALTSCNRSCETDCNGRGFCYESECLCDKWYSGESCELSFNRNYAGVYYGEASYQNGTRIRTADSIVLSAHPTIPNRLEEASGYHLILETDSTLTIPLQQVVADDDTFRIEGEGRHQVGVISFEYHRFSTDSEPMGMVGFSGELVDRSNEGN